jgi:hypothetical protein
MANNKGKKFMQLYKDPDYRLKHLDYNNEKILCTECGIKKTSRCNMKKHQRTKKCKLICDKRINHVKELLLNDEDTDEIKKEKIHNYIRSNIIN